MHNPPQPSLILREGGEVGSVHLTDWPKFKKGKIDMDLLAQTKLVRKIVEFAHAARAEAKIKVRQPLLEVRVQGLGVSLSEELLKLIGEEVNVKEVILEEKRSAALHVPPSGTQGPALPSEQSGGAWITKTDGALTVSLNTKITPELQQEGMVRELTRQINELRKSSGLTPSDMVVVTVSSAHLLFIDLVSKFEKQIKKTVIAKKVRMVEVPAQAEWAQIIEIDGQSIWIGLDRG